MESLLQDLKFGIRSLFKSPGFALVSILTLALGIGANTAVFSVVNAYLLKPLPVADPDELVLVGRVSQELPVPHETSYPVFQEIRDFKDVFDDVSAVFYGIANFSDGAVSATPERLYLQLVSPHYFRMLGVDAAQGRAFLPGEGESLGTAPVMVISHEYWQRRFGGDPSAVGREVTMNGKPFTIVGVLPEGFTGPEPLVSFSGYVPVTMLDTLLATGPTSYLERREAAGFRLVGRLKEGVAVEQAQAALDTLARRLEREHPDINKGVGFRVIPERWARPTMEAVDLFPVVALSYSVLVALVLLIACANVANLTLSRAPARQREIALRAALGADRGRLIRQLLTESLLLSTIGGLAGLGLGVWATEWLSTIRLSADIPFQFAYGIDWRVFTFTFAAALVTGLVAGVMPALRTSRADLNGTLRESGKGALGASGRNRLGSALVVTQVAVSLVLLVASGLFLRSLANVWATDFGFRTENLLLASVDLQLQGYDEAQGRAFYRELVERTRAMPGVRSASLVANVPLGYSNDFADVFPGESGDDHVSIFNTVAGVDYFRAMGMRLNRGRDFTPDDDADAPPVAVINEAMAEKLWPGQDAVGKRFRAGRDGAPIEVVGVVADSLYLFVGEPSRPFYYRPFEQAYDPRMTLVTYTEGDPAVAADPVRGIVRALDASLPVYNLTSMKAHLHDGRALVFVRLGATIVGAFGLLGLALAIAGLYGVVAYSVSQRTREIGVRMALGAQPGDVLSMVVRQGLALVAVGVVVGLGIAVALGGYLASLLYGVSPTDPVTLAVVTALLVAVAALASYIPALRAARVDPMVALKYE
jgi:putative ABC transport system permease protein